MRQPIAPNRQRRTRSGTGRGRARSVGGRAHTALAAVLMAVATAILAGLGLWAWRGLSELPAGTATETIAAGLEAARISAEAPPAPAREPGSEPPPADPGAVETGDDIRYVEGAGIVATRIDGPLTRAPSAVVVPEAAAPDGPKPTLYRLVVIEDADTVNLRSHTVQLANVAGPAADEMCTNASGAVWPCGMRARTALRRLVRSRALECLDLPSPEGAPARATCSAAGEDLSTWLVEHGWARPTNDAPDDLKALHAAAEAEGRGLFNPAGR